MKTLRRFAPAVTLGAPDPALTPRAGPRLVAEVDRALGIAATLDRHIGQLKARRRGLTAGELVLSMAETMLAGGDFMCDLDFQREDIAGAPLRAVPQIPAATTFIGCAKHFEGTVFQAIEKAMGELVRRGFAMLPEARRKKLTATRPTIDFDPTDVEVYGVQKEGTAFNYKGQRCGRPHPAV